MSVQQFPYDIFVSYAHKDDHDGWVEKFVTAIREQHARFTPTPLQIFFDRNDIETMHDWEHRILRGLRGAKVMLAMLSQHYFDSAYCRKEWEIYLEHELDRAMLGQGIAPVYIASAPAFEDEAKAALDEWTVNLRRRQYLDVREWRLGGEQMLQQEDVRRRLETLEQHLSERLHLADTIHDSPTTVPQHNVNFVGRIEELRHLREVLALNRVGSVAVIQGLSGMGKSALTFEYAHAYAGEYPGGRFLVPVAGVDDLRVPLVNLADQKGIVLTDDERKDITRAYARVRAALEQGPRCLLVLDDVDNAALLSPKSRASWLPTRDTVHVVATTTLDIAPQSGLEIIALDVLEKHDALLLLERHRPFEDENERAAAHQIVERLGAHTLGVEVVGVYLWQTPDVNYEGYLARLGYEGLNALEDVATNESIELSRHLEPVLTRLLEPTLSRLKPAEALALEFAALLPHDHIAFPWLRTLSGLTSPELVAVPKPGYPDPWRQIERRLLGLRLLSPGENARAARIHRLVQDVVLTGVPEDVRAERMQALSAYALERGAEIQAHWMEREARWEIEPLLHFALALLEEGTTQAGPILANRVSDALISLGRFDEGASLLRRALAVEETIGLDLLLAETCSNLGLVEQTWGHLEEARSLLNRAINIWENAPESGPDLAMGLCNLALVEQDSGDLPAARQLLERAIAIEETSLGPEHPDLAASLSNLATLDIAMGNWNQAHELLLRALAIEEASNASGPHLGVRYSNLAMVEQALGHYPQAREWLTRALSLLEAVLEADHPHLAVLQSNLAMIERDLGHPEIARDLLIRAIETDEKSAAGHPKMAVRYSNLGLVEQDLGNLVEAEASLRRAIHLLEGLGQHNDPSLAGALSNLALIERDEGKLAEAQELIRRAIAIDEATFGTDHPNTALSYAKRATIERLAGDFEAAHQLLSQAVSVQHAALGAQHPRLAKSQFWLSQVEFDLQRPDEARQLAELALTTQRAMLPEAHPDTRLTQDWLAQNGWQ